MATSVTITISGKLGEGKTCIANIVRQALSECGIKTDMGNIRFLESDGIEGFLSEKLVVKVVEVEE